MARNELRAIRGVTDDRRRAFTSSQEAEEHSAVRARRPRRPYPTRTTRVWSSRSSWRSERLRETAYLIVDLVANPPKLLRTVMLRGLSNPGSLGLIAPAAKIGESEHQRIVDGQMHGEDRVRVRARGIDFQDADQRCGRCEGSSQGRRELSASPTEGRGVRTCCEDQLPRRSWQADGVNRRPPVDHDGRVVSVVVRWRTWASVDLPAERDRWPETSGR